MAAQPAQPDLRFEWLTALPYWGTRGNDCEAIEFTATDFGQRCGMDEADWTFAFVSWASARLIRTGEWYEIAACETRYGIDFVRVLRHLPPRD